MSKKLNLDDGAELEAEVEAKRAKEEEERAEQEQEVPDSLGEFDLTEELYKALDAQGLSRAEVRQAKDHFGRIFAFPFQEKVYLFRALKRREWRNIRELSDTEENFQVRMIQLGCVFPVLDGAALDEELAGIHDMLSKLIQRASGFLVPEEALAIVREM